MTVKAFWAESVATKRASATPSPPVPKPETIVKYLLRLGWVGCLSMKNEAMDVDDMELLRDYARDGSEQAFRRLVERHIDFVYATALRQIGNVQLAQDVTQAVFIVLAEKAAAIPSTTILAGWLFRATRFAASNTRRAEARREHWEQKAAQMEPSSPSEPEFEQVTPLLNEALEDLPELDRAAILLRYFERKTMEEVGHTLGTTENAAKMRLSRAVERLRTAIRQRGIVIPSAILVGILSAQASHAAPAGLAASIATAAILKQSSASTLLVVKGTLKLMAQAKAKKLVLAAIALLFAGGAAVVMQQTIQRNGRQSADLDATPKGFVAAEVRAVEVSAATNATRKVLLFRNVPSWNRMPDFEDTLAELGIDFEVKSAEQMGNADLASYRFVIIPGAQWKTDFYRIYATHAARFDRYVSNGGTLVLELNGAERDGIVLPGGVSMVKNFSLENAILVPDHPSLSPFGGRPIRANAASHGYLDGAPTGSLILAAEAVEGLSDTNKPTFVEYPYGAGRVIAACQCFHDQDRSGRGALMPTLLAYAGERKWFVPAK